MNVLDEVIETSLKIAVNNQDILEKIKEKSKNLMINNLFDIAKIFVARKSKNVAQGFDLEEFKKNDPDGYFNKIVKAFCQSLIDISQEPLNENEKEKILELLDKVVDQE